MTPSLHRRRSLWGLVAAALVVVLVVVAARWVLADDEAGPSDAAAPKGAAFYEPSATEVADGEHGSVIWSRPIDTTEAGAGNTHLVLYRSTSETGETVPVSGMVTVPSGTPPKGGWPVISWGHGTTGTADACAPSRAATDDGEKGYAPVTEDPTADLVEEGYAVVRTDYEGLGTPGPHPYLMGQSSGAGMADMVLAARELEPDLSSRWLAIGHSQGAHAALFTSRFTESYTPGLDLVGIVALAPPSQLGPVVEMLGRPEPPSTGDEGPVDRTMGSSIFLGPLVVAAARAADVPVEGLLSTRGRALLPHLEKRCLAGLAGRDSLGGIAPRAFLARGVDLSRVSPVVETNDPGSLKPTVPLMIVQGGQDTAVPSSLTDRLDEQLEGRGADVEYLTLPKADHMTVLGQSERQVRSWVEGAFGS